MPAPLSRLTRPQLLALRQQKITTPLLKQNSAERVGELLDFIIQSALILATDGLPATAPGAASYSTISGSPYDSVALAGVLNGLQALFDTGPNLGPSNTVTCQYLTDADRTAQNGTGTTAESLLREYPLFYSLGTPFIIERGGMDYRLYYDGGGPRVPGRIYAQVNRDGNHDGVLTDAQLLLADSPEASVPSYAQFTPAYAAGPPVAGYSFAVDELVRFYIAGEPSEGFFAALTPSGPRPAPSNPVGDAYWRPVARNDVPLNGPYIPLTGTARGRPVLGEVQFNGGFSLPYNGGRYRIFPDDVVYFQYIDAAGATQDTLYLSQDSLQMGPGKLLVLSLAGMQFVDAGQTSRVLTLDVFGRLNLDGQLLNNYIDPNSLLAASVVGGTFSTTGSTTGEMTSTVPTGSRRGMRFKKGQASYEFMPNDAGTADTWVRSPVG